MRDAEKTIGNMIDKQSICYISSIARREKLLSNENYVSKAPENIVSKEREDLQKEQNELKQLIDRLK